MRSPRKCSRDGRTCRFLPGHTPPSPRNWLGMIADLLEPHQIGQDQPAPLHPVEPFEGTRPAPPPTGVQRRLLLGQTAEGLHLGLVGKIGDDALVGLEPAEDIGLHQVPERRIAILLALLQPLDEFLELGGRTEQARAEKIEQRPEIGKPVLHRRAGEGDPGAAP